jgi:hypothetical protein
MGDHAAALPRLFDPVMCWGVGRNKQTHNNQEVVARSWTQQLTGMEGAEHNIREVLAWKLGPFGDDSLRL